MSVPNEAGTKMTLPSGVTLTRVTRQSCLDRISMIPLGVIPYSQTAISRWTDRRADCTGWMAHVFDTPTTGKGTYLNAPNTASFHDLGMIVRIDWADLRPGDVIGYFSSTSPRNGGHGAIWMGGDRRPLGTYVVSDHGSGHGPKSREVTSRSDSGGWLAPSRLAPWRYVAIVEAVGQSPPAGASRMDVGEWVRYPMASPGLGIGHRPLGDWLKDGAKACQGIDALATRVSEIETMTRDIHARLADMPTRPGGAP